MEMGRRVPVWNSSNGLTWSTSWSYVPWSARTYPDTAVFQDKLWLAGGYDSSGLQSDLWSYNGQSWSQESVPWSNSSDPIQIVAKNNQLFAFRNGEVWFTSNTTTWSHAHTQLPNNSSSRNKIVVYKDSFWYFRFNILYESKDGVEWTTHSASHLSTTIPSLISFDDKLWFYGGDSYSQVWSMSIPITDTDSDEIAEHEDNCQLVFNPNQLDSDSDGFGDLCDDYPYNPSEILDTDNDGIGNNADTDDDNDGIPDIWEIANGLDSLNAADAQKDTDEDGLSNLEEYLQGSYPNNAQPQLLTTSTLTLYEDSTASFILQASDEYPSSLTWAISIDNRILVESSPSSDFSSATLGFYSGELQMSSYHLIIEKLPQDYFGQSTVTVTLSDEVQSSTHTILLEVVAVDDVPELVVSPTNMQGVTYTTLTQTINVIDLDNDSISYVTNIGRVDVSGHWSHSFESPGTYTIFIDISDGLSLLTTQFSIQITDGDNDQDGILNRIDNCQNHANANQHDLDGDGLGDVCDNDIDGDGIVNASDAFPYNPSEILDTDNDGIGNNADTDDDNDNMPDIWEIANGLDPLNAVDAQKDADEDGLSNLEEYQQGSNPNNAPAVLLTTETLTMFEDSTASFVLIVADDSTQSLDISVYGSRGMSEVRVDPLSSSTYRLAVSLVENHHGFGDVLIILSDGEETSTYTLTLQVIPVNDPPVISSLPSSLTYYSTVGADISVNRFSTPQLIASDVDGDTLIWSIIGETSLGYAATEQLSGNADNVYAFNFYTHLNSHGSDTLLLRVSDGHGGFDQTTVTISVIGEFLLPVEESKIAWLNLFHVVDADDHRKVQLSGAFSTDGLVFDFADSTTASLARGVVYDSNNDEVFAFSPYDEFVAETSTSFTKRIILRGHVGYSSPTHALSTGTYRAVIRYSNNSVEQRYVNLNDVYPLEPFDSSRVTVAVSTDNVYYFAWSKPSTNAQSYALDMYSVRDDVKRKFFTHTLNEYLYVSQSELTKIFQTTEEVRWRVIAYDTTSELTFQNQRNSAWFTLPVTPQDYDITPHPFAFGVQVNQPLATMLESSETVTITGIDSTALVSIENGEFKVYNSTSSWLTWFSTGWLKDDYVIAQGERIQVRHMTSNEFDRYTTTTLTVGDFSTDFVSKTRQADKEPDMLTFDTVTGAQINQTIISNTVLFKGFEGTLTITVEGGEFSINGELWQYSSDTVNLGDSIRLRQQAASTFVTEKSMKIKTSEHEYLFRVITEDMDTVITPFSFATVSDAPTATEIFSGFQTISGINAAVPISISGSISGVQASYRINDGEFTNSSGFVNNQDIVQVKLLSASSVKTRTTANLNIGSQSVAFSVITVEGNADEQPDTIPPVLQTPEPLTLVISDNSTAVAVSDARIQSFIGLARATDNIDGEVPVTNNAPNIFTLGTTTVTFRAVDSANNRQEKSVVVHVQLAVDTIPPVLQTPEPLTLVILDNSTAVAVSDARIQSFIGLARATDNIDGEVPVTNNAPNIFTLGTTTVTFRAVDSANNRQEKSVVVHVQLAVDTIPPVLQTPEPLTLVILDNSTAVAVSDARIQSFIGLARATDNIDGEVQVTNNAPNIFTLGTTTVTFRAVDSANNSQEKSVVVHVQLAVDTEPPIFSSSIPSLHLAATGLYTPINRLTIPPMSAYDSRDGVITAEHNLKTALPSGIHRILWTATDQSGNRAQVSQILNVYPQSNLSTHRYAGDRAQVEVGVYLTGPAPVYPVVIPLTVDNHPSVDTMTITIDSTIESNNADNVEQGTLKFPTYGFKSLTMSPPENGNDRIIIRIDEDIDNAVKGKNSTMTIHYIEENIAPIGEIVTIQGVQETSIVDLMSSFVLTARVIDPNVDDTHTYLWTYNLVGESIATANTQTVVIDYSLTHQASVDRFMMIKLEVTDSQGLSNSSAKVIRLVDVQNNQLSSAIDTDGDGVSDAEEGLMDSDNDGIPDYQDNSDISYLLPSARTVVVTHSDGTTDTRQAQAQVRQGYKAKLGQTAMFSNRNHFNIDLSDIEKFGNEGNPVDNSSPGDYQYQGDAFDFEITELPQTGGSIAIAIPLNKPLLNDAVYRKYSAEGWSDFVTDSTKNTLESARSEQGVCPDVDSVTDWLLGLIAGNDCLKLTIEDGGVNDSDGHKNAKVADPGAIFTVKEISVEIATSSANHDYLIKGHENYCS